MNWETKDDTPERKPDIEDKLRLTNAAVIHIFYSPCRLEFLSIDGGLIMAEIDRDDREGTRRRMLTALVPRVEAALVALREAVAELPDATVKCGVCGIQTAADGNDFDLCPACYEECRQEQAHEHTLEHDPRLLFGRHTAEHDLPIEDKYRGEPQSFDMSTFANDLLGGKP